MESGKQTIARIRAERAETLLAFSCGKDSIAGWLKLRESFGRIEPFYQYIVPGLSFVEDSLSYYERFFGKPIRQVPHPSFLRMLKNFVFQPPERCEVIEQAQIGRYEYTDVNRSVAALAGLPADTYVADGVRAADSPMRMMTIRKHGAINWKTRVYHPVWDMRKVELVELLRKSRIKLPIDYRLFGRTFDGLDLRFLLPIKKHLPQDYRRILEWFPLADAEVFRWERARC